MTPMVACSAWMLGTTAPPDESAGAARSQIATLSFAGPARRSQVNCHGGVTVDLDVYPEIDSHHASPADMVSHGRFVAMVKNVGTARCNDLKLSPGDSVYWWMGPRGGNLVTEFYEVPPSGPIHRVAKAGPVIWHTDGQRPAPDAKIATVIMHPAHSNDGDEIESVLFGHNSTWIACLGGCCESAGMLESLESL
jgi:hypothetical protein